MKHGRNYIQSQDLARELELSQKADAPTVKLCEMFREIASHLLGVGRYRMYGQATKEDMVSAALLKCLKNVKNYRPERAKTCFNYYTRCCEHAFWEVLKKYYRQMNIQRELTRRYADRLESINTSEAKQLRDSLLKNDTTNTIRELK